MNIRDQIDAALQLVDQQQSDATIWQEHPDPRHLQAAITRLHAALQGIAGAWRRAEKAPGG